MVTVLATAISIYLIITLTPIRLYRVFPLYSSKHPQALGFTIAIVSFLGGIAFVLSTIATSHFLISEVTVQVLLGLVSGVLASVWLRRPTIINARIILIAALIVVGAGPSYWRDTLETLGIEHIGPFTLEYQTIDPSGLYSVSSFHSSDANRSTISRSTDPGEFGFARISALLDRSMEWDREFFADPSIMPLAVNSAQYTRKITNEVRELEDILKQIYTPFSECYEHVRRQTPGSYRADSIALKLVDDISRFLKGPRPSPDDIEQYAFPPPEYRTPLWRNGEQFRSSLSAAIKDLRLLDGAFAENHEECKTTYSSGPNNIQLLKLLRLSRLYPYTAISLALIRADLGLEKIALQELLSWRRSVFDENEYLSHSPFVDLVLVRVLNLATLIADKGDLEERFEVRLRFIAAAEQLTDKIRVLGGIGVHGTCKESPRHNNIAVYIMTRLIGQNTFADAVAENKLLKYTSQADSYSREAYKFDIYECLGRSVYSKEQLAYYRASFLDTRAKVIVFVGVEDYMQGGPSRIGRMRVIDEAERLWTGAVSELEGINISDVGQNHDLFVLIKELRDNATSKLGRLRRLQGTGGW